MTDSLYTDIHSTKHAGKVALINGGCTGIGPATAKHLARERAAVFITGPCQAELDRRYKQGKHHKFAIGPAFRPTVSRKNGLGG